MQWSHRWVPLHQSSLVRKDKHEHYWVVGFGDTELSCIITKGADKFPPTLPRPVISCISLKMPLLQVESYLGTLEEGLRASLFFLILCLCLFCFVC